MTVPSREPHTRLPSLGQHRARPLHTHHRRTDRTSHLIPAHSRSPYLRPQAYVAISRVRSLSQLHLWCLHREAFTSDPRVTAEYNRLRAAPLTADAVNGCVPRERVRRLLPLAAVQAEHGRSPAAMQLVPRAPVVPLSGTRALSSQARCAITRASSQYMQCAQTAAARRAQPDHLQALARAHTFSLVYVPFLHAVLRTGECAAQVAVWSAHDARWAYLVHDYRSFYASSPVLAALLQPNVIRTANATRWPYLPAAAPSDCPSDAQRLAGVAYPLRRFAAADGPYSQEGLLSQSSQLFGRLQLMVAQWVNAARNGDPVGNIAAGSNGGSDAERDDDAGSDSVAARHDAASDQSMQEAFEIGCCICGHEGFLAICDGCQRACHAHMPCANYAFPPSESDPFRCCECDPQSDSNDTEADASADDASTFDCSICFESRPAAERINVDGCTHDDCVCTACMFRHARNSSATCPICRNDGRVLQQAATGREIVLIDA
jgi:hypothetical protein